MTVGCGCQSGKKFVWTNPDSGVKVTYKTEVEARAAVIRSGGSYVSLAK